MAARRERSARLIGTSDVAGLDPFDLLDTESKRVAGFFTSADEDAWARDTRCEGLRVRELLSHVAGVETYHLACLNDAIPALMEEAGKAGVTDVHSFNDWAVKIRADRAREDVMDEWRTKNAEVRRRMREIGAEAMMSSMVGPYPVGLMAFHVASEYATHADDMDIANDEGASRTGWRAKVSQFALKENEKPVEVSRSGNDYVVRSGSREAMLSETDFVEAVTARRTSVPLDDVLREALIGLA